MVAHAKIKRSVFDFEGQLCSSSSVEARAQATCMHETLKCFATVPALSSLLGFQKKESPRTCMIIIKNNPFNPVYISSLFNLDEIMDERGVVSISNAVIPYMRH